MIALIYTVSAQSYAEIKDVFQIITGQCLQPETLTGFRMQGVEGIVTALHGVVGCNKISALVGGTKIFFRDLQILKADLQRDVALLSSPELQGLPLEGLKASAQEPIYTGLYVIGYPLGIKEQLVSRKLLIRDKPLRRLDALIPPALNKMMAERNSPSLDTEVLSIEGHLLHGHSGAPILNEHDQVVGVANGGLQDGTLEIVWAIPWHEIAWTKAAQLQAELVRLARLPKAASFSSLLTSEDRLTLKIAFKEAGQSFNHGQQYISQDIYTNRSAQYLVPLPQELNPEHVEQFILLNADETVLTGGYLNTSYTSSDGRYGFKMSYHNGFFLLDVTSLLTLNPVYLVNLLLPSSMVGAEILIDRQPADIVDQTLTTVTIRVKGKDSAHQILVQKGNLCCSMSRVIRQNSLTLTPCATTRTCQ